jgi:hypothetical protein
LFGIIVVLNDNMLEIEEEEMLQRQIVIKDTMEI